MSQKALNLSRSVQTVRRNKLLVAVLVAVGLLGGVAYAILSPPLLSSTALVILPNSAPNVSTQLVIAQSDPVLTAALPKVDPQVPVLTLRKNIKVRSQTNYVLAVTATGRTAVEAETTANAVANSYIAYVAPRYSPVGHVLARTLSSANVTTGQGLVAALIIRALLGALLGFVVAAVAALVISRNDKKLRERDDIANSIGIPVLASIPVGRPTDAAGWAVCAASAVWVVCVVSRFSIVIVDDTIPGTGQSFHRCWPQVCDSRPTACNVCYTNALRYAWARSKDGAYC